MGYFLAIYNPYYQRVPGKIYFGKVSYGYTRSKKLNIRILS
jgi:hypothetical protein